MNDRASLFQLLLGHCSFVIEVVTSLLGLRLMGWLGFPRKNIGALVLRLYLYIPTIVLVCTMGYDRPSDSSFLDVTVTVKFG